MWYTWNKWLILSHVLHDVIKQEKKIKKIRKKHGDDMWNVRKVGGSFPYFDQFNRREIKRDKEG